MQEENPLEANSEQLMQESSSIFANQRGSGVPQLLTVNIKRLLQKIQLTKEDLDVEKIGIDNLERAVSPTFLGKCLYLLVTFSISRTLMLWPFMLKEKINLNNGIAAKAKRIFLNKSKNDILLISNVDYGGFLSVNEIADEESDVYQKIGNNKKEGMDESSKKVTSDIFDLNISIPILNSSSLLFESEINLKAISGISAFHDTIEGLLNGVWNAFLTSLIIHGVVNYIVYPDERAPTDLMDVFGITGLRNIACIRSIKIISNSALCSSNYKMGYGDILSSSLSSYYVWPFIAGIPLIFATINALHASWNMKLLDEEEAEELVKKLEEYKPKFWADVMGWIFTAAIPDLFPPAAILFMLPQPAIKQALEKIKKTIIWDVRILAEDRLTLFNYLHKFSQQHSNFTQMKSLSMLADIVENISFDNLSMMKDEGIDNDTIKTLIIIKVRSLKELDFLSKNYNLPDAPRSAFRPLFRYLYSNYLMWSLGYPQQRLLQPLFFATKTIKLYFTLIFFKAIIGGVIEIINNYLDRRNCYTEGKIWRWMEIWKNYTCSVCGDLPIFVNDIWTVEDCFRAYLAFPRNFSDLIENTVNRENKTNDEGILLKFNLSMIKILDLSAQYELFNYTNLDKLKDLLAKLTPKLVNLKNVTVKYTTKRDDFISVEAFRALMIFAQQFRTQLDALVVTKYITITSENSALLNGTLMNDTLINSTIKYLDFDYPSYYPFDFKKIVAMALKNSAVTCIGSWPGDRDDDLELLANNLPATISFLPPLEIKSDNTTALGCHLLAKQLSNLIALERITILARGNGSLACYAAFANSENPKKLNLSISFRIYWENHFNISLLTQPLSSGSFSALKILGIDLPPVEDKMVALFEAISNSSIRKLLLSTYVDVENINQSYLMHKLINMLEKSAIIDIDLGIWNDDAGKVFAAALHKLSNLQYLTISFPCEGTADVLSNLPHLSHLIKLDMSLISKHGHDSDCIDITYENIITSNIRALSLLVGLEGKYFNQFLNHFLKKLHQSKIEYLELRSSSLDDENATISLIQGLAGSAIQALSLRTTILKDKYAAILAAGLIANKTTHGLWTDWLERKNVRLDFVPNTNLTALHIDPTHQEGLMALCKNLPYTKIPLANFGFLMYFNNFEVEFNNCGVSSSAHSLRPVVPYVLLYRLYKLIQQSLQSFYTVLYMHYKAPVVNSTHPEPEYNGTTVEQIPSACLSEHTVSMIDASHYSGGETIVVDLNTHDAIAARGGVNSNNLFIGGDDSLLDVSQNRRTNFLQSGKNNKLRLGFFSKDHVVVGERQGTIQIEGFDSKDTLHLISEHTVYNIETNITICQNEIIENDIPAAVIHLKETTIQLVNTRCEDIENNIEINNDEAIYAARVEVMDSAENHQSILYINLLSVCETFLNSVSKSAMFTAVPVFAAEILYQSGGYTRGEAEKFGQEIQTILVLSFADSPHAIAASFLASWLASRLTNSPNIISTVGIGASIVIAVAGTVLSANVTLGWMALQTGVALMGSVAGSYSVRWGFNKASSAKNYLSSKLGFWSDNMEEIKEEKSAHQNVMSDTQSVLPDAGQDITTHFTL